MRTIYVSPGNFWERLTSLPDDGESVTLRLEGGTYLYPSSLQGSLKRIGVAKPSGGSLTLSAIVPGDPAFVMDGASYPASISFFSAAVVLACERVGLHGLHFKGEQTDYAFQNSSRSVSWNIGAGPGPDDLLTDPPVVGADELTCVNCKWSGGFTTKVNWLISRSSFNYTNIYFQDLVCEGLGDTANAISAGGTSGYAHIRVDGVKATGRSMLTEDPSGWAGDGDTIFLRSHGNQPSIWGDISDISGESSVLVTREDCLTQIYGVYNHDMHCMRYNRIDRDRDRSTASSVVITHRDGKYRGEWKGGTLSGQGGGITNLWYYHGNSDGKWSSQANAPKIHFENFTFEHIVDPGVGNLSEIDSGSGVNLNIFWCAASADYYLWDCKLYRELPSYFEGTVSYPPADIRCTDSSGTDDGTWVTRSSTPLTSIGEITSQGSATLYNNEETRGYTDKLWWRRPAMKKFTPSQQNYLTNPEFTGGTGWTVLAGDATFNDGYLTLTHDGVGVIVYQDVTDGPTGLALISSSIQHVTGDKRTVSMEAHYRLGGSDVVQYKIVYDEFAEDLEYVDDFTTVATYDPFPLAGWTKIKRGLPTPPANFDTIRIWFQIGTPTGGSATPVTFNIRNPVLTDA